MKTIKTILSLCLVFFCLFGSILPAAAETPKVTFENEGNAEPDLFITKKVESLDERYPLPEGTSEIPFSFTLKLGDKFANKVGYRVFNESGEEVFRYEDGEDTEDRSNKIPYETDRTGSFTLKAGQTARFEYVGEGKSYEVTETPVEGFEQTVPAGGLPAVGTIPAEGAGVQFTNTYIPGGGGTGETSLQIQKNISYPNGYEVPITPDFTFVLELQGKPYANEDYSVVDNITGSSVEKGQTDQDGRFTLKGGQTAKFEAVPSGADYKVTEEETAGWRTVGERINEGATRQPLTMVNYTNANASFAVSKKLNDNSKPEVNFTFVLTDQSKKAMKEAAYYLYTAEGALIDDQIRRTDEQGRFNLMPGQTAVFFGIPAGTVYNVYEEVHQDFKQNIPLTSAGYTDKKASDAVEVLPFVNEQRETSVKVLTVTKKVVVTGDTAPEADQSFTFKLLKKDGDSYAPVEGGAVYLVEEGNSQKSYRTNEDGTFTLKENQTARFEELKKGTAYQVTEVDLPFGYSILENEKEGILQDNLYFSFTNQYSGEELKRNLNILKRDNSRKALGGAVFALYADKEMTRQIGEDLTDTQDAPGLMTAADLELGTYYLMEKQAPAGYQLPVKPVKIEIFEKDGQTAVKVNEREYTTTDQSEPIFITPNVGQNDEINVTIYNKKTWSLPVSGGRGIVLVVAAGLLGIGVILLLLGKYKKVLK